jgi:hypothetical protein
MEMPKTIASLFLVAVASMSNGAIPDVSAATLPLPDEVTAKAAIKCQRVLLDAGAKFVAKKLAKLEGCTGAVLTCVETKGGTAKCLASAKKKCAGKLANILSAEVRFAESLTKACEGVSAADTLDFASEADECLKDFGADVSTIGGVVSCVVREHARTAEQLFAIEQARTVKLLEVANVSRTTLCDVPTNDEPGCDGCAVTDPPGTGKDIAACAKTINKAGTAFAVQTLKSLAKCMRATFACAATPLTPDKTARCGAKATATCTKASATLDKLRGAVDAAIVTNGQCGAAEDVLPDAGGLNLDALAPACTAVGSVPPSALAPYAACLRRHHECGVQALARFAAPRLSALSGDLVLPDPPCPTPAPQTPLTVERITEPLVAAVAVDTPSNIGEIVRSINSPQGTTEGELTPGGFKPTTVGATNSVRGVSGDVVFVAGRAKPIKIAYSACGNTDLTPSLIVSARDPASSDDEALLEGFFDLPLPKPQSDRDEAEIEVTFQPETQTCVRLAFATECGSGVGSGVSPYVRFEQVPLIDPKETTTPTPAATQTATPTSTAPTPTRTTTPTSTAPTPTRTATPTATGPTPTPTEPVATCTEINEPLAIAYGEHTANCNISPSADLDRFEFQASAGDDVRIVLANVNGPLDPKVEIFDPTHASIGTASCSGSSSGTPRRCTAKTDTKLTLDGAYTLFVTDSGQDESGGYTLEIETLPSRNNPPPIAYGSFVTGTLERRTDFDFFTFEGLAGSTLRIAAENGGGPLDVAVELIDPNGALSAIGSCDGSSSGTPRFCSFENTNVNLTISGTYQIVVEDLQFDEAGQYKITLDCLFGSCP